MMRKIAIFILFFTCSSSVFAADNSVTPEREFIRGAQLLQQGKTDEALRIFEDLQKSDFKTPELYCDMGNAFYQTRHFGKAIACYEKGLLLAPRDTQLMHNRTIAASRLKNAVSVSNFYIFPGTFITQATVDGMLIFAALLLALSGILFLISSTAILKSLQSILKTCSGTLLVTAILIGAVSSGLLLYSQRGQYAIITTPKTESRIGPSLLAKKLPPVNEGEKVSIQNYYNGWYKIQLYNGSSAWVNHNDLDIVE